MNLGCGGMLLMKAQHHRNAEILSAPAFDAICEGPAEPVIETDAELEDFIRQTASTIWHTSSTCRMGPGDGAVAGPNWPFMGSRHCRSAMRRSCPP